MKRFLYILLMLAGITSLAMNNSFAAQNIAAIRSKDNIKIYPNPTKNSFFVSVLNTSKIKQVTVFNIIGHKVLDYKVRTPFLKKVQINISRLPSGKYFVRVLLDDKTQKMKHLIKI